ncbi:hypothetical protein A1O3_00261 [Capronia epimyces CBS 606.96]|uniref:3-oxoacyl-[acyl-carrier protein] reductase n=1 Tax=Capronia epimyces CBS 606.96 TaxID=1182542 RepID=W9YR17_9EURO|nr:uncharacterized protein A1O3_00261 [Capronia epimyces CBS 606.96]EXJ91711.1 hypothetical protein A1O3_00261 [Capronia epimyces CBS 606.96]
MSKFDGAGAALVTGAGGSIGSAVAAALVQRGCSKLVLADISTTALEATQKHLLAGYDSGSRPLQLLLVKTDIRLEESVDALLKTAVDRFGAIHYFANCAGIMIEPAATLDTQPQDFLTLSTVNQRGTWLSVRAEVRQLLKQEREPFGAGSSRGSIVNVSSVQGLATQPGMVAFAAASHGIVGLTRSTALDYIDSGIRFNCVCPAATESAFLKSPTFQEASKDCLPAGGVNQPSEVANAIVFLLSPDASAINGVSLPVDRGWTLYHH